MLLNFDLSYSLEPTWKARFIPAQRVGDIEYTRKGYHKVFVDGVQISQHSSFTEPYEVATQYAIEHPGEVVQIVYANVEVKYGY